MDARKIDEDLTVSPQITVEDVKNIAALGYKSLVCNRPDNEDPDQPPFEVIAQTAADAGLQVAFQPVVSGMVLDEDAAAFGELMKDLPKPIFAFCRTGTRCTILWSLTQKGSKSTEEILKTAADAGFNLAGIAPRLEG